MALTTLGERCDACGKAIRMTDRVAVLFTGVALRYGGELVIDDSQKDSTVETLHQECYAVTRTKV